jgi:hypothetical protein
MIMEKQSVFVVSAAKQIDAVALVIAEREQLVREREWELLRLAVAAQPTPTLEALPILVAPKPL